MDCKEACRGIGFFVFVFGTFLATIECIAYIGAMFWNWFDPTL